ncbi:repressor LexA [Rhodothalassium salexigens DSM 2132]|uniref:LexA repressor n=1 Tax=Rhodothalassium salexigens DSM 2132 TaxID=1188247 RepID=A0A4R2PQN0_RHOSA|nr:transcriptional repressor LexA [Rhodothalassium salexigens]MBB4209957.1 repressor LexA [Rhodothalassium salexigens DSM 2132]MBK1637671.1 repressor LexA [Rhodothalassium salexigens DSM 2132]TCP38122.1 repressor LexA [Rhodothalassium salexigens DSM 2132]
MLTAKQMQLLQFIHTRLQDGGVSPSFDEMKEALALKSKSGVHRLITALEERGFIRRLPNRARALEVLRRPDGTPVAGPATDAANVDAPRRRSVGADAPSAHTAAALAEAMSVPLHGRIAAGTPIEALEHADVHVDVPPAMMGRGPTFALEVDGDSMVDLGIMDGDTVLIERCETAEDGTVVVALVDESEATLKTLKRRDRHIMLIPANRDYEPQVYESDRVRVQGRLVGLLRRY